MRSLLSRGWLYGNGLLAALQVAACALLAPSPAERPDARLVATYPLAADSIGAVDKVTIYDGGYSALALAPDGTLWVTTDRGPNLEAAAATGAAAKRFPLPGYMPSAVCIERVGERLYARRRLPFRIGGRAATGLPPPERDTTLVVELALGPDFARLRPDPTGIDSEGLAFLGASLWLSEEYRPSLWQLDSATGQLRARYTPTPTDSLDRPLPAWLLERSPNLGFEGLTAVGGVLYAALQGPLQPPGGDRFTALTRILRLDPATGQTTSFLYALDGHARKIGDLAALPDGRLLVLEHGPGLLGQWSAEIYVVDLRAALPIDEAGPAPERFRDAEAARAGGQPILPKGLYVDLLAAGWSPRWDKPEGLEVDGTTLLLVNDNDYGLDSPGATGAAVPTNAETVLVVIE